MKAIVTPSRLCGEVALPPSKSIMLRAVCCAAFGNKPRRLICGAPCDDALAGIRCIRALGAKAELLSDGVFITPTHTLPKSAVFDCGDSAATLRFFLAIACAADISASFVLGDNLAKRSLSEELEYLGGSARLDGNTLVLTPPFKLHPAVFASGSQFASGFRLASLPTGKSFDGITASVSLPYIALTDSVIGAFAHSDGDFEIPADASAKALFAAANSLGGRVRMLNSPAHFDLTDKAAETLFTRFPESFDFSDFPDLFPIAALTYAAAGKRLAASGIGRLASKESNRIMSTASAINALGGNAFPDGDVFVTNGAGLRGGSVNTQSDHRIAMAACIVGAFINGETILDDIDCINKSYPDFINDYVNLGGHIITT